MSSASSPKLKGSWEASSSHLGASYAFGLVKNHGYVDGNKRVGFLAAYTFLDMHGLELKATEADVVETIEALAKGTLSEEDITEWVRRNV